MYLRNLLRSKSINSIYNQLTYINYNDFLELRQTVIKYINPSKKFNISDIMYNEIYNVKLLQLFDNTRIYVPYQSLFICLNGSIFCKDDIYNYKLTSGCVDMVETKYKMIYNPQNTNNFCIIIEKDYCPKQDNKRFISPC